MLVQVLPAQSIASRAREKKLHQAHRGTSTLRTGRLGMGAPGGSRRPAPGTQAAFRMLMRNWFESSAICKED